MFTINYISDESLMSFCRALVSSVRSGLPLGEAFETLAKSPRYRRLLDGAYRMTAGGAQLHEAFSAQRGFPPIFIVLLRAGEEAGKTDEFLELYADCLEVRVKFRRQLERMLVYPLFVVLLAAALFLFVSFKVVPMVLEPLMKSGAALPPQTFLFTSLAERLVASWPVLMFGGALFLLALRAFLLSVFGRKLLGMAGHWLPVFRYATEEARLYYIYTTIGLLMKAGLAPGAIMDLLIQFSHDDLLTRRRLRRAEGLLSAGEGFAASIALVTQEEDREQIEIAEKAGRMDETLLRRARLHYDIHLHRMKILMKVFNFSTLAAIALVCFALILTVIWPAISVVSGAGGELHGMDAPAEDHEARELTPEESRTRDFNSVQGRRIADMMQGGNSPSSPRGGRKKLSPPPPIKKINLSRPAPTNIKPTDIHGN